MSTPEQIIALHSICECGEWAENIEEHASHILAALKDARYAVVQVPEVQDRDRWDNPRFTVGCLEVTAYPKHGGHIQLHMTDPDYSCLMWWPGDMREMAAALLAAADSAEDTK